MITKKMIMGSLICTINAHPNCFYTTDKIEIKNWCFTIANTICINIKDTKNYEECNSLLRYLLRLQKDKFNINFIGSVNKRLYKHFLNSLKGN